ncbi:MAG: TlpA family protein disulfide reductase [Deltaproteobacteria bacterium]|nr:TlpA family protein disulfide reductase [Deltaproteobacteria bacterium]
MRLNIKIRFFLPIFILAMPLLQLSCQADVGAGPPAPDFSLQDLSGNDHSLPKYSGKVVLLDFWATWCPPCRLAIPELISLQKKYGDRGLVVLGVSVDDPAMATKTYLRAFKNKFRINYTILRVNRQVMADYFGNAAPAIPTMFLIDREGRIQDKFVGFEPGAVEKSAAKLVK